jgi:flagellar biosynthesis protein FlhF
MRIRKFEAPDMREALALVKRELGPDAMVIATRQLKKGLIGGCVEVTAAVDEDGGASADAGPGPGPSSSSASYGRSGRAPAAPTPPSSNAMSQSLSESDVERIMAPLRSELRSLRTMLRAIGEPAARQDDVRAELAALRQSIAGMTLAAGTQVGRSPQTANAAPAAEPTIAELAARSNIAAPSERRVVVVVGPTGVGKTTTIAKLAARAALVAHEKVAILTLDSYRVGGEEQMRTYADLIGVPLTLVPSPDQLQSSIASVKRADRIFVDTAGRSPREAAALTELAEAILGLSDAEVHLAVPAGLSAASIDACFRRFSPLGLDRLLFTKLDEAEELEQLVRAPARLGRPVSHITTGQRVPEDFEDASTARLVDLATRGFTNGGGYAQ